jgi:hypothetical protein
VADPEKHLHARSAGDADPRQAQPGHAAAGQLGELDRLAQQFGRLALDRGGLARLVAQKLDRAERLGRVLCAERAREFDERRPARHLLAVSEPRAVDADEDREDHERNRGDDGGDARIAWSRVFVAGFGGRGARGGGGARGGRGARGHRGAFGVFVGESRCCAVRRAGVGGLLERTAIRIARIFVRAFVAAIAGCGIGHEGILRPRRVPDGA